MAKVYSLYADCILKTTKITNVVFIIGYWLQQTTVAHTCGRRMWSWGTKKTE